MRNVDLGQATVPPDAQIVDQMRECASFAPVADVGAPQ